MTIDSGTCQGHGRCVIIAPTYFDMDDDGWGVALVDDVAEVDRPDVDEAIASCPENAITLSD